MTLTATDTAIVFPGQGSQAVGMLKELSKKHTVVKETFDAASEVLGRDLWKISQEGPETALNQTTNTQPIMLASGVAVWRTWTQLSHIRPVFMAGHSLGEYTALVCSGALAYDDAISLVQFRAEAMQKAVPEGTGAMAAIIGLDNDILAQICNENTVVAAAEIVEPVNFNAPGQTVIAGSKSAVDTVLKKAKEAGAKRALPLPVSVPSHCSLMRSAAEALGEKLSDITISTPSFTVLHNVDAKPQSDSELIRSALVEQLYRPVQWVETVESMHSKGVNKFLEMGTGKVLSGLIKRIEKQVTTISVQDEDSLHTALEIFE